MLLNSKNPIASIVLKETNGNGETYLTGDTVSIYWNGATRKQIERLKILLARYIGYHMMMDSYKTIRIYS